MSRYIVILFALFLAIALASCGQKGPLKLPPATPGAANTATIATAAS